MQPVRQTFPAKEIDKTVHAEKVLGKRLPSNINAERAVLGTLLLNDDHVSQVAEILVAVDFYHPAHKLLYQTILDLGKQLKRIDLVTLQDELEKKDQLAAIGGI